MKNGTLGILAVAVWLAPAAFAQDITGTWQGTLAPPNKPELRVVFKVSKDANGLRGLMYTIDQGPQSSAGTVTLTGTAVKISVPALPGTYEGKLDSDGVNLTGTWTQGGSSQPLNLTHVKEELAWPLPEAPARPARMAADADPAFEAASIKPSDPAARGRLIQTRGEFRAVNAPTSVLMEWTWAVHARQIVGAPAWLDVDKYDIVAKPDAEGLPSREQWKTMVGKLLADRFKLTYHREKRELPVYAIQIGKNGPKLTKSAGDPNGGPSLLFRRLGELPARNASMAEFAGVMQTAVLDRPVVDQTGIEGKWDFLLTWTPDGNQFAALGAAPRPILDDPNPDAPPDLVTAMQNELGLKLSATKAMVDVIVIDHVEKPSGN
jgi:uncharacterized protein (TIGR03435 family)